MATSRRCARSTQRVQRDCTAHATAIGVRRYLLLDYLTSVRFEHIECQRAPPHWGSMIDRPDHLRVLPAMTDEVCTLHLLREYGHLTMVVRSPRTGMDLGVFTLHCVEATKLAERIHEIVNRSDGATSLVEGVYLGGPPGADDLLAEQ